MKITVLYGTESGNAELLSEDIEAALSGPHEVETGNLEDVAPDSLSAERFYIFVCSTYGEGDLPASAMPFAEALEDDAPDLSHVRYAIFGLGDMNYPETYNQGSAKLAALLEAGKATMIGERGLHDAASGEPPEDVAIPWAEGCIARAS